ncbi:hypothetical protein D3C87_1313350 [compost metagenome]
MIWLEIFGTIWKSVIRARFWPMLVAAVTYSRDHICSAAPSVSRAKTGTMKVAMAMMAVKRPVPMKAPSIMADRIGGTAKMISQTRMTTVSVKPRSAATATPMAVPIDAPMATAAMEVDSEFHAPAISMDNTSRPK